MQRGRKTAGAERRRRVGCAAPDGFLSATPTRCLAAALLLAFAAGCSGGKKAPPKGQQLLETFGCTSCHSTDASVIIGPTFKGIFGRQETVVRGRTEQTITVDEAYLRRSILDPRAEVVKGFPSSMPTRFANLVSNEELDSIVEYLKTL